LRADLYEGVDIEGNRFLLISTFPLSGVTTSWKKSVLNVVDQARKEWVEMKRLNHQDGYKAIIKTELHDDPCWTQQPIKDFVIEAFGDCVITADNLPAALSANKKAPRNHCRTIDEDFDNYLKPFKL
jgi:hypothetical protein